MTSLRRILPAGDGFRQPPLFSHERSAVRAISMPSRTLRYREDTFRTRRRSGPIRFFRSAKLNHSFQMLLQPDVKLGL